MEKISLFLLLTLPPLFVIVVVLFCFVSLSLRRKTRQNTVFSETIRDLKTTNLSIKEELNLTKGLLADKQNETIIIREKNDSLRDELTTLRTNLQSVRVVAVNEFKTSQEFKEILADYKQRCLLDFKDQENYQKILKDSIQHRYCEEIKRKSLQDLIQDYEERLKREREEFNRLQEQFNFEKRYKNVSNIGEQLTSAIVDKLTETFVSSGLVTINPNPPLKPLVSKRNKSVRTDVLLEVFSPLQRERRILTVVIEAKNQKPDTLEPQRNKRHFEQLFEQLEAYEADYALLVTELEPDNSYLTISPIENRDDVFMLRLSYLVGFLQILIRFAFKSEYYGQDHKRLKSRENLIRIIDSGKQELEDKQFRYLNDSNKRIRDRCENIKSMLDDIDELTHKNDRRLKLSSKKLLSFYEAVNKEVKQLPTSEDLRLLSNGRAEPKKLGVETEVEPNDSSELDHGSLITD